MHFYRDDYFRKVYFNLFILISFKKFDVLKFFSIYKKYIDYGFREQKVFYECFVNSVKKLNVFTLKIMKPSETMSFLCVG